MKRQYWMVTGLLLLGCHAAPPRNPPQVLPQSLVSPPPVAPPVVAVAAPPAPALSVVVEGHCPGLSASFFKNATLIHSGQVPSVFFPSMTPGIVWQASHLAFALVRADGSLDEDPKLRRGLPEVSEAYAGGGQGTEPLDVAWVSGACPDQAALTLIVQSGNRMGTQSFDFAWKADHWTQVSSGSVEKQEKPSLPWMSGSGLKAASESAYPEFVVVPAGAAPTPDFKALHVSKPVGDCIFVENDVLTRPSGELFLAGKFCGIYPTHEHGEWRYDGPHPPVWQGEAGVARWAPGGPAAIMAIPPVANREDLALQAFVEASPTSMYLLGTVDRHAAPTCDTCAGGPTPTPEAYLAFYDGAGWSRIETPYEGLVKEHGFEADGTLWVADSSHHLYRRAHEGVWAREALEAVTDLAWQDHRPTWAVAGGALMRHGKQDEWTRVELPRPAFSSSSQFSVHRVSVSPGGDVWVRATYEERRPEWTTPESREALLRFGATQPAMHCDVDVGPSLSTWPPPATATCEDPVVIVAHVSKSAPPTFNFPQTRAALRGHTEIDGAEFVEIEIDGKRLLAAKVRSIDMGTRLVDVVSHGVGGTRPELVCTKPNVTRTLTFDLRR